MRAELYLQPLFMFVCAYLFVVVLLGIEHRASNMVEKHSTTEKYSKAILNFCFETRSHYIGQAELEVGSLGQSPITLESFMSENYWIFSFY